MRSEGTETRYRPAPELFSYRSPSIDSLGLAIGPQVDGSELPWLAITFFMAAYNSSGALDF
jgi:hypothetical protein